MLELCWYISGILVSILIILRSILFKSWNARLRSCHVLIVPLVLVMFAWGLKGCLFYFVLSWLVLEILMNHLSDHVGYCLIFGLWFRNKCLSLSYRLSLDKSLKLIGPGLIEAKSYHQVSHQIEFYIYCIYRRECMFKSFVKNSFAIGLEWFSDSETGRTNCPIDFKKMSQSFYNSFGITHSDPVADYTNILRVSYEYYSHLPYMHRNDSNERTKVQQNELFFSIKWNSTKRPLKTCLIMAGNGYSY